MLLVGAHAVMGLESLYQTELGALLVHIIFVLSWTIGGLLVLLVCCGLASYTYGTSILIFGVVAMEGIQPRRALAIASLAFDLYLGPRSPSLPGFWRYWILWVILATMSYVSWFCRFPMQPSFMKLIQSLGYAKWYKGLELRGAVEDIQKEKSLFGFHPHGILCIGFSLNGCWSKPFLDVAGDSTMFLVDKVLREDNPIFKVICDLHGHIGTLSKSTIHKCMSKGTNVAFVPGGFEDATVMCYGKDRTAMRKRQGFIKYALQHGYRVHPIYTFGESDSHYTFTGLLDFRLWLNKFGIPAVVIFGFPWIPVLPRRQAKIQSYVGKALQLPKIENPSKEDVAKWHGAYIDALQKVFEDNKKEVGLPDTARLEIM